MDVNTITQMVSSIGFPIASCIAIFWYMAKQQESHSKQIEKMTEALNNNTLALTRLEMKIGDDNADGE